MLGAMDTHPIQIVIFGASGDLTAHKLIPALASLAAKALDFFVHCYGTFAGDIALAFLARGGREPHAAR